MPQQQFALKHIPSILSIRPSSTGRVAFTESSDTVSHSLVSSLFVCLCSYSAKSNSVSSSEEHVNRNLYLSSHTRNETASSSMTDRVGPYKTWLYLMGLRLQSSGHLWPCDLLSDLLAPCPSSFPQKQRLVWPGPEPVWLLVPFLCVWTHTWQCPTHSLMSCDSDILASVFLTRRVVRREAGLWAQHSVISFPICLKHWGDTDPWNWGHSFVCVCMHNVAYSDLMLTSSLVHLLGKDGRSFLMQTTSRMSSYEGSVGTKSWYGNWYSSTIPTGNEQKYTIIKWRLAFRMC